MKDMLHEIQFCYCFSAIGIGSIDFRFLLIDFAVLPAVVLELLVTWYLLDWSEASGMDSG